ncbi:Putative major facilitator, sugar transporter, major facilitator superfamily [Septoria linicola]|uniref:Major facilitator, sugar transporter, major facilitator superfamily n=1 Tax=Septoria linicola TaxID=215465 RepID=A0A9Q9AZ48_9PEZI|nr:putative major facilitator, sugar transporter, major facilitator superfamily [Septoria linicola]USW58672.1 Putative major facilitator, sugar transporter, major facilitator superfamily [Septoria linicola]
MSDLKNEHYQVEVASDTNPAEPLETKFASLGRWEAARVFWKAMLFCMILNWAALNDGFQQQVPGNIIPLPAFVRQMADTMVDGEPAVSARTVSFWQGFAEMSKMVGMFTAGYFADKFGRKKAMCGAIAILLGGSIAEIASHNWQSWLGAAVLVRLGVGLAQSILITYISELAPFQIRGFMIGAYQLMLAFGQLLCAVASQLVQTHRPNEWRILIGTEFIFTGILICMIWVVPESHLYHARKGNVEGAKKSMRSLYGNVAGYDIDYEYRVIEHGIAQERALMLASKESSFFDIFRGTNWRRTLAGAVGICSQWAAGAPIVFSYSTYFFEVAGLANPFLVTIITFVLLIVSISCSLVACEYVGRRPLLVGGCALMCLFNIGLATSGIFDNEAAGKAALACLLIWVICYGASAGPIGFVAAGETSTPRLRAQTTSFNLGCYGAGFVVFQWTISYMISPDAANLGVKAVYVWAGLLVPTTILLWMFYPETQGRTYWELDELYERRVPAWKFKETKSLSESTGQKAVPRRRSVV